MSWDLVLTTAGIALRARAGATMFYGHDEEQWAPRPRAPAPVA